MPTSELFLDLSQDSNSRVSFAPLLVGRWAEVFGPNTRISCQTVNVCIVCRLESSIPSV